MKEAGYNVADDIKEGGNKCFQKWRNLEKSYQNYKARSLKTGNGFMKAPPHYDILHCFMESKHKINPPSVLDTLSTDTSTISKCIPNSNVETVSSVSSPIPQKSLFIDLSDNEDEEPKLLSPSIHHNPKTTLKPTNNSDKTITKQHSEMMMIQKDQHLEFMKVLNEQTKYRAQMAGIFETIAKSLSNKPAKKRKHHVSSSESD